MTVRYQGAEFTIDYRVIDQEDAERVTSVALYGFDPLLFVGDSLEDLFKEDASLPSVTVTYGYGYRVDTVDLDVAEMLSGELTEGRCELTLTYEGVTAPVYVTVHPEADKTLLTAIRAPAIVEATVGSEPDFSRYTLSLVYGYGYETRKIPMNSSGVSISEYSTATQGMRHVFVTYTTQDRTFTCDAFLSFTYGTGENVLDRIEVTEGADKEFAEGETFSGVKIRAYYLSGTNKEVEVLPDMVEGFSTEQVGKYEATIVYGGKSAPYSYTVVEAPEAEDPQEQPADPEQQQQPSQQPEEQENGTSNESPEAPAPQPEQPEPQPEV